MPRDDTEEIIVFEDVTSEIKVDQYALGVEAAIRVYRRELISRGFWPVTLREIEDTVTREVMG